MSVRRVAVVILPAVFVVAVTLLVLWTRSVDYKPEIYGTLAAWVSGVFTATAVSLALGGFWYELRRDRVRLEGEQQAEASLVVVVAQPGFDNALHASFVRLWVNIYGGAPLRSPEMTVSWPRGYALPGDEGDDSQGTGALPNDPTTGQYVCSHLDPVTGANKVFRCTEFLDDDKPECLVRWFDRWDTEWWAQPDRVAERVPLSEQRAKPGAPTT